MRTIEVGHISFDLHKKRYKKEKLELRKALNLFPRLLKNIQENKNKYLNNIIFISDVKISKDGKYACILFFGIDTIKSPSPLVDIETLTIRKIIKRLGEGIAISSHLVIKLDANASDGLYPALIESTEGIARTAATTLLDGIIQKYIFYKELNEEKEEVKIDPKLSCMPLLDRPVQDQLKRSKLVSVEIVKSVRATDIDNPPEFYEKKRSILYKPTKIFSGEKIKSIVRDMLAQQDAADYPQVKLHLEEEGEPHMVTADRSDSTKADIFASAFQKKSTLSGLPLVDSDATDTILDDVMVAMISELEKN